MLILAAVNVLLMGIDQRGEVHIPTLYFEIYAIVASLYPPIWSKFLDLCKQYIDESTPPNSTPKTISPAAQETND